MKVLQINSVCGIKSTGRICTDIAEVLEQQGHECKIAYGRESVPEKYQRFAVRIGSELNVRIDGIKSRLLDNAGFNSAKATKRFLAWVKEYDPDIIHLHNIHGYYIHVGLLFAFLKDFGKPVVWTLHDCWPFTGHCAHFDYVGCEKWKTQCGNCPQKREYPSSILLDSAKRNHRLKKEYFAAIDKLHFIAISDWMVRQKAESFLKDKPHTVIHNGIDLEQFKPLPSAFRETHAIQNKRIYLGVASAWTGRKGFDAFLKLSQMLSDEEVIVMVGLTEAQLKRLPKNIIGIKRTNSVAELAEIYSAADVFVNPTMEDNFPTVNLEAQACGIPVVTYNTGGSPECILPQNGIVVPKGDVNALLDAARTINRKNDGSGTDLRAFDKTGQYQKYIDVYQSIL